MDKANTVILRQQSSPERIVMLMLTITLIFIIFFKSQSMCDSHAHTAKLPRSHHLTAFSQQARGNRSSQFQWKFVSVSASWGFCKRLSPKQSGITSLAPADRCPAELLEHLCHGQRPKRTLTTFVNGALRYEQLPQIFHALKGAHPRASNF